MKNSKSPDRVKIFVGYYRPNVKVFKSNVFLPISTSVTSWLDEPDMLHDNIGTNIAGRNKYYGELSGHYWVWKNFLPKTKAEYIGFCHYRRFFDFGFTQMPDIPFRPMFLNEFEPLFEKYTEENIMKCIEGYDIILPHKFYFGKPLYEQYIEFHPKEDLDLALDIIKELYPEYYSTAQKVMADNEMFMCLNFIMKTKLVEEYMEWIFNILAELEKRNDWSKYTNYLDIRVAAFIAERFFNIWLLYNIEKRSLKVLKTTSVYVMGENYSETSPQDLMFKYVAFAYALEQRRK